MMKTKDEQILNRLFEDIHECDAEQVKEVLLSALRMAHDEESYDVHDCDSTETDEIDSYQLQTNLVFVSNMFKKKATVADFLHHLGQVIVDVDDDCITAKQLKKRLKELDDMASSL